MGKHSLACFNNTMMIEAGFKVAKGQANLMRRYCAASYSAAGP